MARFASRDDLARFVPNVTTVVVPLVQVASCEQQGPDNIRMAVAHGKVCWGRKARVLYIDLDPSFQERFDHIQVPLCSARRQSIFSFRATCPCTRNSSRNDGKQGQIAFCGHHLLRCEMQGCTQLVAAFAGVGLLIQHLSDGGKIANNCSTCAAKHAHCTRHNFRDEQCACTSTINIIVSHCASACGHFHSVSQETLSGRATC